MTKFLFFIIFLASSILASAQDPLRADANESDIINKSVKEKLGKLYQLQLVLTELDSIKANSELQTEGIDAINVDEEKLLQSSRNLECSIEPLLLYSFKRIRITTRNKIGIVNVNSDACGGCSNKIPQKQLHDINYYKKVVVCEYCGRILIAPKLAASVRLLKNY